MAEPMDLALWAHVGGRLREARQSAGLTQDELAGEMGLTRTSVVNIEGGHQRTHLEALYRAADCLGIEVVDLLPGLPASASEALRLARRGRADAEAKLAALSRAADSFSRRHEEILRHA